MKSTRSPNFLAPVSLATALAACLALTGRAVADEHAEHAKKDEPCVQEQTDAKAEAATKDAANEPDEGRTKPKESWTSGASTSDLSPQDDEGEDQPDDDGQR